jgi:hypothetical protein
MRCLAATRNQTFGLETLLNLICGVAIDHLALALSGAPPALRHLALRQSA